MHHEGILIFIFLALVLLFPIIIFLRVYGLTYSGLRTSGYSKKPAAQHEGAAKSQPNSEKQAEHSQPESEAK